MPAPPIAAASLGALVRAAWLLGDLGDLPALSAAACGIRRAQRRSCWSLLQRRIEDRPRAPGCRAGLFDCSLPAWPAGAWRDPLQWPTLLAGLAMLPMMAALPLMAAWCRAQCVAPQAMVLLHLAAMFGPALLLRQSIARWSLRTLSIVCTILLAVGAAFAAWAAAPLDLLGLAVAHGAAWGLAWAGQLWAPARRGQQGTSPLRAAAGYALVDAGLRAGRGAFGARGVAAVHVALGLARSRRGCSGEHPWSGFEAARLARMPATVSPQSDHGAGR